MESRVSDWTIISLGNRFRGDDSVGPYLLHRLRNSLGDLVEYIENAGDMTRLLEDWRDRCVCLVDAVVDEERHVGDIVRLDGLAEPMPESLCTTSTHGLNLTEAIEMARLLDALPKRLDIYAICGANFTTSAALSPEVTTAAEIVEREILKRLMNQKGDPSCTSNP